MQVAYYNFNAFGYKPKLAMTVPLEKCDCPHLGSIQCLEQEDTKKHQPATGSLK